MKRNAIIAVATLVLGGLVVIAQDAGQRPPRGEDGARRPGGGRMFGNPLMAALDANKDGELDSTEISNASAALKKLDKNADGKVAGEELRPERPPGGPEGREGRPGREGGPRRPQGGNQ